MHYFQALLATCLATCISSGPTIEPLNEVHLLLHCGNSDVPTLQRYINNYGAEAINGVRDWKGASCLHKAAYFGDEKMTWLLLLNGAEPNLEDGDGDTPLSGAAEKGKFRNVEVLLAYGADASFAYSWALYESVWGFDIPKKAEMARLLLRHGANPNDQRPNHKSAFMNAVHLHKLNSIGEMAKWMERVPEIRRSDVFSDPSKYEDVMQAIQLGQWQRQQFIGQDECLRNPCLNEMTCIDKFDGFQCNCPTGVNGPTCRENIGTCDENNCSNNQKCSQLSWLYFTCSAS